MRTEVALQEFIASRIAANLSPSTISWYEDGLFTGLGSDGWDYRVLGGVRATSGNKKSFRVPLKES